MYVDTRQDSGTGKSRRPGVPALVPIVATKGKGKGREEGARDCSDPRNPART